MAAGVLGIVSGIIGIAVLLLRYYPEWKRGHNAKMDDNIMDDFGQALLDGDDARVSELLDAEFRRVRGQKGGGAA